ncbi:hypothetical protein ACJX0J_023982, partial [Zea mays]
MISARKHSVDFFFKCCANSLGAAGEGPQFRIYHTTRKVKEIAIYILMLHNFFFTNLEGLHNVFLYLLIYKDKILLSLKEEADAKRIADLEYALSVQVGLHRSEEIFRVTQNEKESHTTLEETRKAEEVAERERLIGIIFREIF